MQHGKDWCAWCLMHRYLEWVKAGDDSAILHMAAPGGVGKLALGIRPRAGAPLKLTTHFQGQPFGVPSHGHADCHQSRSQALSSGGDRRTENCLMRARVTKSDARQKNPQKKHRGKRSKNIFSLSSAQTDSESFWLGYFRGCLLVLPGKSGSWSFTGGEIEGVGCEQRPALSPRKKRKEKAETTLRTSLWHAWRCQRASVPSPESTDAHRK